MHNLILRREKTTEIDSFGNVLAVDNFHNNRKIVLRKLFNMKVYFKQKSFSTSKDP